jgi:hypothetical protein
LSKRSNSESFNRFQAGRRNGAIEITIAVVLFKGRAATQATVAPAESLPKK